MTGLLLGGCATTQLQPNVSPDVTLARWAHQKKMIRRINKFMLDAQVGANGSFGMSGSLRWVQDRQSFRLHFSGPFDTNAITVTGNPAETTIHRGSHTITTINPQTYLYRHFHWTLPIAALRYWVLGLPLPNTPAKVRYNGSGTLRTLRQDGWYIKYESYQNVAGYILPLKFRARANHTEVRMEIYRWAQISPPAPHESGISP